MLTNGGIEVEVTNNVGASDGAILNAFTADIDFAVEDSAQNIADQVNGTNGSAGSLDDAERVIVDSGTAIDAADAQR